MEMGDAAGASPAIQPAGGCVGGSIEGYQVWEDQSRGIGTPAGGYTCGGVNREISALKLAGMIVEGSTGTHPHSSWQVHGGR